MKRTIILCTAFAMLSTAASKAAISAAPYRLTKPAVSVTCSLTAGAGFEAHTNELRGELTVADSGEVTGAVDVTLATLSTGIGLRDRHMRDTYLEVGRGDGFATARLEHIQLARHDGPTTFSGILTLHGQQHPIAGTADLQWQRDGRVRVQARFPISIGTFGIAPPRYLGMGVQDQADVSVTVWADPVH